MNRIICLVKCKPEELSRIKEFAKSQTGMDHVVYTLFRAAHLEKHLYSRLGDYFDRIDVADGAMYDSLTLVFWPRQGVNSWCKDLIIKTLRSIEATGASVTILRPDQQLR